MLIWTIVFVNQLSYDHLYQSIACKHMFILKLHDNAKPIVLTMIERSYGKVNPLKCCNI